MRSLINHRQKALSGAERCALFHQAKRLYGQALLFAFLSSFTPKADCEFARRQPVEPLAAVPEYSDVHIAEKLLDEFRTDLRIIIKEPDRAAAGPGSSYVARLDFSFPF